MDFKEIKKGLIYISYALLLYFLLYNIRSVAGAGCTLLSMLFPFLLGAGIAFLLSLPMGFFERKLERIGTSKEGETSPLMNKWKRPLSLLLTILVFLAVCCIVVILIIPAIQETAQKIVDTVPIFLMKLVEELEKLNLPADELEKWLNETAINWSLIGQKALDFLQNWSTGFFASTFGVVTSVVSVIADGVVALIFAIYILFAKESLYRQFRMLCDAFLPAGWTDSLFSVGKLVHKTFASFFAGQCTEACILGIMFMVVMAVLRIPYAVLIGVLIGVTSLIPIFGAFIGCFVGALLIVMVEPMKALIFLVVFLLLQQIEGNLIYPKVVGGSVGLPGIWVLMAVSLGGSIAGVLGMILFIPLFSVGYTLLKEKTKQRLEKTKDHREKTKKEQKNFTDSSK